jgi:glutamate N-acetyltransferase/amino-acid N-acetyltransferase
MTALPPLPAGFRAGSLHCGVKKKAGAPDLALLLAEQASPAAALFTRNELLGAHVILCREHLARSNGLVRAVLVNSGNANCATGTAGIDDARVLCARLAELLRCPPHEVLMISTGVIGARLPVDKIATALPQLVERAAADGLQSFARAIMTTDTREKITVQPGDGWTLAGAAKGAGMIHPDLATMLAFLLTDARAGRELGALLREASQRSFQRLSIDGDTSPNDTVLLWSSARAAADTARFAAALTAASQELCRAIAGDGEGLSRLITVRVQGAASEAEATHVGRLIATSPLVKTAVRGLDPNWGRILAAAGRAGVPLDMARVAVRVGDAVVFADGRPHPEREKEAHRHMVESHEVLLGVDLGRGEGAADVWTCDLTEDYVKINAEYRT